MIVGTEEFRVSTHSSRRTGTPWPMIRDGESGRSIRCTRFVFLHSRLQLRIALYAFVIDPQAESLLVDASATRWKAVEPQQLPDGYDPGIGRCRRNSGAYSIPSKCTNDC